MPPTIRMTAVIFLDADDVIAKKCMKMGGFIPMFLKHVPTGGADRHTRIKQVRLFCQSYVLDFL